MADHNDPNAINSIFSDIAVSAADLYDIFGFPNNGTTDGEKVVIALTFASVPEGAATSKERGLIISAPSTHIPVTGLLTSTRQSCWVRKKNMVIRPPSTSKSSREFRALSFSRL